MFRYHALCGVSIMAIQLAWIARVGLGPWPKREPTALPPVNVEAPREARARPACAKTAYAVCRCATAGETVFRHAALRRQPAQTAVSHPERSAGQPQSGAERSDRHHDRPQPVRQPAVLLGRRRAARQPGHLHQAGQRPARFRHLDPRLQRPQRLWHPQHRDLRRRFSGDPAGWAVAQRPDRSARLWRRSTSSAGRPRRCTATTPPAARSISAPGRAARSTASNTASMAAASAISTTTSPAGKKGGNFEYSLFVSDVRGDGYIQNSWFNTQTVNFLGTLQATPGRPLDLQADQQ